MHPLTTPPEFEAWFKPFRQYQLERERGVAGDVWARLNQLDADADRLTLVGLDILNVARALLRLERATLWFEQREYAEAEQELTRVQVTTPTSLEIHSVINASREMLHGNIYHAQGRHAEARQHYVKALDVSGAAAAQVRANASFNNGVIYVLEEQFADAKACFERSLAEYAAAEAPYKFADCWHQLAGLLRQNDDTLDDAISMYEKALERYVLDGDLMGQWRCDDDLARALALRGNAAATSVETAKWYDKAFKTSQRAAIVAGDVWRLTADAPERLPGLSEQLLNHTMSFCELAARVDDMPHMLGALAVNKSRMRLTEDALLPAVVADLEEPVRQALEEDDPRAYLAVVHKSLPRLNACGDVIAIVDQLGHRDDRLFSCVTIFSADDPMWDFVDSYLHPPGTQAARRSLRGADRCAGIQAIVDRLLGEIRCHANRCAFLLADNAEPTSSEDRKQLATWAGEFEKDLRTLGDWFFPELVLDMMQSEKVQHVVLVSDPAFLTVPYSALETAKGAVVDQSWSLSVVNFAFELARLAHRRRVPFASQPVLWMGPEEQVNQDLGGNEELVAIETITPVEARRGAEATLDRACTALGQGRWVHFRGHGDWDQPVEAAGPVFAGGQILDRSALEDVADPGGGYLVTAACRTGSAASVGTEAFGASQDCDRARLNSAILTCWPIHGPATTPMMQRFYKCLIETKHVAQALQRAARLTRDAAPHPYIWAPFFTWGAWEVQ